MPSLWARSEDSSGVGRIPAARPLYWVTNRTRAGRHHLTMRTGLQTSQSNRRAPESGSRNPCVAVTSSSTMDGPFGNGCGKNTRQNLAFCRVFREVKPVYRQVGKPLV
jgi:hypothetical protein